MLRRVLLILVLVFGAEIALIACGDIRTEVSVHPTPSTECQDHTLPCAGPTSTVPVMDPRRKDETMINRDASSTTTTTVTLPVTS